MRYEDHELYDRLRRKAVSFRLPEEFIEFFMKYAQKHNTKNLSDTVHNMIAELHEYDDLEGYEFTGAIHFEETHGITKRERFLVEKKKDREEILLEKISFPKVTDLSTEEFSLPKVVDLTTPEPEEVEEPGPEEEDEGVLEI